MRVLFLCNKSPFPPREGGPLAMNANIKSLLKAGHEVKVLALNTNKYKVNPKDIPDSYQKETGIEFVHVDLSIKPVDAFLNLFSKKSFHVERFISEDVKQKLEEVLKQDDYDIVQLEMLYMTPYMDVIRKNSKAKVILRSHNIEHLIWQRVTDTTKNPLKAAYLKHLTGKLKMYELENLNRYDGIACISSKDADFFRNNGCKIPITTVPFGVDIAEYSTGEKNYEFPSLFHIGSMNWMPNEEGIRWFLEEAWPLIHKEFPTIKLYLAGREMPAWLSSLNQDHVEVLGEVEDAQEFIHSKAIMVVPLFSGSGIRIKIIEGMAMGKAIISTSIGAEGIPYTDNKDILIANTPAEFLAAVKKCTSNREVCDELGHNARKLIEKEHSLEAVIESLEKFYHKILEN
ncbi:MAG: glycosyltransferase family 4 protein [Bacteroidetes bacterium]|nr:glycosyltransferase family 4 protein [Bacteroidota bacterium]